MTETSRRGFVKLAGLTIALGGLAGRLPLPQPGQPPKGAPTVQEVSGIEYARSDLEGAAAILAEDGSLATDWAYVGFKRDGNLLKAVGDLEFQVTKTTIVTDMLLITNIGWWQIPLAASKTINPEDTVRITEMH